MSKHILIENAYQNNLKHLDLKLPYGELIVITGVSGSGKSTLAFDTIYAEGQRRYVETFSPYARQFLDRMDKPQVDRIEGIPPAIAIDQTNPVRTSRSTVGTMTELNDHIKLLFARTARLYCGDCGKPVTRDTPEKISNDWFDQSEPRRIMVTFQVPIPANFSADEIQDWLARQGYTKVHQQSDTSIDVIQDRLSTREDNRSRFIEAIEAGLRYGQGKVSVHTLDEERQSSGQTSYSTALQCEACGIRYREPIPSSFSFNSPIGACESCKGFGRIIGIDYRLALPDVSKTLKGGAVKVFQSESGAACQRDLERAAKKQGIPLDVPFDEMTSTQQNWVIQGDGSEAENSWYGIKGFFDYLERKSYRMHVRVMLAKYRSYDECPACHGARLKPASLNWRVGTLEDAARVIEPGARYRDAQAPFSDKVMATLPGLNIVDLMQLPLSRALQFVEAIAQGHVDDPTDMVVREMRSRLAYLNDVGLSYLTLDRQSRTLSGGEVQRINLTTALGTSLVNTLFVLDEPSIGLHAQDMDRVIRVLKRLRDAGNTLIVVEHDPQLMLAADRIIDIGPGPGRAGGNIVFNGKPAALLKSKKSLTAKYLNGEKTLNFSSPERGSRGTEKLILSGANGHNLQDVTLEIPLNRLVCLTGPSGSGKSTLIQDTLFNALTSLKGKPKDLALPYTAITGDEQITDVILVDQSPIGKSARSNPVSYTGAFESIRKLFEKVPEAQERGYKASAFSFNSGMRCPACSGNGFEHVEMQFLSDVYLRCAECQGRRYRAELLEIKLFNQSEAEGQSIADVLEMTVERALEFFAENKAVITALSPLREVGLGYLQLGQPVPTLSGGEAQRLKLAAYLGQAAMIRSKRTIDGHTLFLFDEPTTGLHFEDIGKLLNAFEQLVEQGHSLVVIEHNLDVIANADWIIDLGPAGGDAGGKIVCKGTPVQVMAHKTSVTAASLRDYRDATDRLKATGIAEIAAPDPLQLINTDPGDAIVVHKAREHNLKNIDVRIPRDKMTVITGMSGSGKSTLAFDIVFNEGQRRYLESLNAYARQFVQPASRPDVDAITGIPPTVAIEQRTSRGGRKSTVATMTEIYHFLRLLFVKLGVQHCPDCEVPISAQSVDAITAQVLKQHRGKKINLHAPLIVNRKGYYTDLAKWALNKGFTTLRVDGKALPTTEWPRLDRFKEHTIDLPVGTFMVDVKHEAELQALIQRAIDYGSGVVKISSASGREKLFSTQRACPSCQRSFAELDPRMFSYNSRHGWCESCFGTGEVIPGFDEEQTGEERSWSNSDEDPVTCPQCEGQRLKSESLAVYFQDWNIADYTTLSIVDAGKVFSSIKLNDREATIARDSLKELNSRLSFLVEVGLEYLSLDRAAPTLSGGEAQRIRLAAQLGSNLQGVCYILDEPTIGLHPRDNRMLLDTLARLLKKGNTIVVVEHDEETILSADHIIDIGPGAGVRGGEIVASGTVAKVRKNPDSVTGRLLDHPLQHPLYPTRTGPEHSLHVTNAHLHNLKNVSVDIPLGQLVCVTGVSGSGKSTLIRDVVHDNLRVLNAQKSKRKLGTLVGCEDISGWESISRLLEVDQTPIGKTSRSCPATYIGFWDNIRRLFADTTEARIRGYNASRFSFNTGDGRCEECAGQGMQRIEMSFLPDVRVLCEVCNGMRFNHETLSVRYKDKSIGDVLMMNVDEGVEFFDAHVSIRHALKLLQDVGLGYLTLGQQSRTLSGGEAQRIKLVTELSKAKPSVRDSSGKAIVNVHTLYILDEPTVGLHMADVENLIHVLHRLVEAGNSVIVIEHNLDIMAEADWIIDMGPEGGTGGGKVVARGTPKKVSMSKRSRTAPYLQQILSQ
ncbi:excinuclease ABC subunit UvrA [Granulosicoccus antarcticus]|uniref:UvrABC system protein A n=1 Tax=Granulosicoccus antarcticus IMCC3135 TaxID=1192854 RepID=A0A2Z2NX67_9GAMM|nr:excinuclease ABC subunit UvrA [Granulosicoccus antarcticus]ASJ71744.1 UvrABC system protein A [Granulosicoccus antarcticus IMCC3135]